MSQDGTDPLTVIRWIGDSGSPHSNKNARSVFSSEAARSDDHQTVSEARYGTEPEPLRPSTVMSKLEMSEEPSKTANYIPSRVILFAADEAKQSSGLSVAPKQSEKDHIIRRPSSSRNSSNIISKNSLQEIQEKTESKLKNLRVVSTPIGELSSKMSHQLNNDRDETPDFDSEFEKEKGTTVGSPCSLCGCVLQENGTFSSTLNSIVSEPLRTERVPFPSFDDLEQFPAFPCPACERRAVSLKSQRPTDTEKSAKTQTSTSHISLHGHFEHDDTRLRDELQSLPTWETDKNRQQLRRMLTEDPCALRDTRYTKNKKVLPKEPLVSREIPYFY